MALAAPSAATVGRNEREGTSAYNAGHTAGRTLAQTHHTQAPPATDDFTSQLLTLLGHNTGPTPAQLALQAKILAGSDVATQVAAYRQQQQDLTNQAAARAAQINAATLAATKYLYGPAGGNTVADATAASFNNAAKTEAAIAGGYSGQLRQTATDEAAKVQAGLDSIGAPAGQAPSSTQGQDLSNVLYGLGGQIPANVLVTAGQGAAEAARFLPGATLGYGAGEANLARGAGASAAAGLLPDIRNAVSQQPKLEQQYLSSLGTQADNAQSRQQSALALASLIQSRGDAQTRLDAPKAPKTFGSAKSGYYTIGTDGKVTQVTDPVVTPGKGSGGSTGGLTADAWKSLTVDASKLARQLSAGKTTPAKYHFIAKGDPKIQAGQPGSQWVAVPGTGSTVPATNYSDALAQVFQMGPSTTAWANKALAIVNASYKPGQNGRPYGADQAKTIAAQGASAAYKAGVSYDAALASARAAGVLPDNVIVAALDKVYKGRVSPKLAGPYSPIAGSPHAAG